jgi:outer membrane protein TolC
VKPQISSLPFNDHGKISCLLLVAVLFFISQVNAEELPTPLTLEKALSLANSSHPDLLLADANVAHAVSRKLEVETNNHIDSYLEVAHYAASFIFTDGLVNDSYLRLSITKTIYDFGYSENLESSVNEAVFSQELIASNIRNQHYLKIMQSYFNVLLVDLQFAAINEEMTSLFLVFDKLRERQSLGMISEVEVSVAEKTYRDAADRRKRIEINQQGFRQRLAIALNRPGDLPGDLIRPKLPQLDRPVPELETLLEKTMKNNLQLASLQHALQSDKQALKAAQQQFGPTISAELEINEYARQLTNRESALIGVALRVPFLNGSRSNAKTARATAQLSLSQARYDQASYSLRQQLSDLIRQLNLLHYKRKSDEIRLNSTALEMEKARGIYELEIQTTLGSTTAKYTEAEWLSAKNDFEIATTWTQIDMLTGKKLYKSAETGI